MTQTVNKTFYNYLTNNKTERTELFKKVFGDKIYNLPENIVSSKIILKTLNVKNDYEFKVFQNVFLDYFKDKLNN